MTYHRYAVMTLVFLLGPSIRICAVAHGQPQGPPQSGYYGQEHGDWDAPPREYSDIQRQGFRDGIEGARRDIEHHRQPDPNNRDEYRHPNAPRGMWDTYREGFRRGYDVGVRHLMGGEAPTRPEYGVGQPGPDRGDRGAPNGPGSDARLRGFQDGMVGALRDVQNRRRPDPNNRDEYRSPNVPYGLVESYREGFRHGYERSMALLTGGYGRGDDFMQRAFQDGVAGALNDFSNNRRPDPNNRDEYRHPNVPYGRLGTYQDGFRHGYQQAMSELTGYYGRR